MSTLTVLLIDELRSTLAEIIRTELQQFHQQSNQPFEEYPALLTRAEAANMLGVSIASIDNWAASGRLKKIRMGKVVRFKKEDLIASLNDLQRYQRPLPEEKPP